MTSSNDIRGRAKQSGPLLHGERDLTVKMVDEIINQAPPPVGQVRKLSNPLPDKYSALRIPF
jgi:hypothetical protein